ncbi:MBL fold metallo-hydrolase [Polaribacter sp. Z014]|uniref:ComEC/Rec2 family competence protein n=1 Tax=Polaribacter sp. Z014 TaxID=2927126 RepID=UPI002021DBD5|nr:MBL fold metallo-hydrolase [Polaribacter sp. Z014]MCL7762824.1 MBL fold metallo-hydrolase [Polaribacter sp. Z014]
MSRIQTEFTILAAYNGDSILIKTFDENKDDFIILVDGGTPSTFDYSLKKNLNGISKINLLVLTHIDSDHVGGLIKFFKNSLINKIEIDEVWINQPNSDLNKNANEKALISVRQAENLKALIIEKKPYSKIREITIADNVINIKGLEFTILSPTVEIKDKFYEVYEKEKVSLNQENLEVNISLSIAEYSKSLKELNKIDFKPDSSINKDIYNSSSIAFVLKCPDVNLLLLADSRAEIITKRLKELGHNIESPLEVDYVKISHHGSLNNTSQELLSLIKSSNYLISTNGGTASHKHPARETIARIVHKTNRDEKLLNIYTNYKITDIKIRIGEFVNENDLEEGNWNIEHKNTFTKNDI